MSRTVLHSPLDPVAVARKLKAAVGDKLTPETPSGVTGHGTDQDMTLSYHRKGSKNPFARCFIAEMIAENGGTRIEGRFGLPMSAWGFAAIWFGFLSIFIVIGALVTIFAEGVPFMWSAIFMGVPLFMMAVVVIPIVTARRDAGADEKAILGFLKDTIGAVPRAGAS